jgi:hypothetical protein
MMARKLILVLLALILFPAVSVAENLYVTQAGAGAHDGSSVGNAWSAAEFNTSGNWGAGAGKISGGDTVYLSTTITTGLTMQGSGTSGNVITIDGTDATLSGVFNAANRDYWKLQNATWSSGISTNYIITITLATNAELNNITIPGYNGQEGLYLYGASFITVDGMTLDDLNLGFVDFEPTGGQQVHDITFRNLDVTTTQNYMPTTQRDFIRGCAYNVLLEKSYINKRWSSQTGTSAHNDIFQLWGSNENASCPDPYNITIRYNYFITDADYDGNYQSIVLQSGSGTTDIYANIIEKRGSDKWGSFIALEPFQSSSTVNVYNNTFVVKDTAPTFLLEVAKITTAGSPTINYKNNILYDPDNLTRIQKHSNTTFNHSYNTYYGGSPSNFYYNGASWVTCVNYISTGEVCGSDPLFTNYPNNDFRIGTDSPAYNAGTDLGSSYNSGLSTQSASFPGPTLVTRPQFSTWDIGGYEYVGGDTTPPVRYSSTPGSVPPGTTQYNITLTTTDDSGGANCKWDADPLTAYADMSDTFDTTGGSSHSDLVTGLSDGNTYSYYVRCEDLATPPNANQDDYLISFSVQEVGVAGGSFSGQGTFQ